jgi:hypothetical protein
MNIAAMARKFLALPLTGISLSRVADFDNLEDPDLSERFELCLPAQLPVGSTTLWQKISKLHNSAALLTKSTSGQLARVFKLDSDRFLNHSLRTASAE